MSVATALKGEGGASRPLFLIAATFGVLAGACGAPGGNETIAAPSTGGPALLVERQASTALGACGSNRVLIGPGGRAAAVWTEELLDAFSRRAYSLDTERIQIIPSRSGSGAEAASISVRTAGRRLHPLSWSPNGTALHALWGRGELVEIVPDDLRVERVADLGDLEGVRFTRTRHSNAPVLLGAARPALTSALEAHESLYATLAGDRIAIGVADAQDGTARPIEGGGEGHVPALLLRDGYVVDVEGRRQVLGLGNPGAMAGGAEDGYRRPLFDLATGRLIGSFGLLGVHAPQIQTRLQELLVRLPSPYLIRDVSISAPAAAILYSDMAGEVGLAMTDGSDVLLVPICDFELQEEARRMAAEGGANPFSAQVDMAAARRGGTDGPTDDRNARTVATVDLSRHGESSEALGTLFRSPSSRRGDIVVYFHGGPASSGADEDISGPVRRLALPDTDFLYVEYSGSAARSPALFRALAAQGPLAVERDVAALARWIDEQGYSRIHLIGGSFGSVPVLAALEHPALDICSASLIVPLIRYRENQELALNRRNADAFASYRALFERHALGGAAGLGRLRSWLAQRGGALSLPSVRFYFAESDRLSSSTDLEAYPDAAARARVFSGTHASVPFREDVWRGIRTDIEDGCER